MVGQLTGNIFQAGKRREVFRSRNRPEVKLEDSPYSFAFKVLTFYGFWPLNSGSAFKQRLFFVYRCLTYGYSLILSILFMIDFVQVASDLSKVSWNICVNFLFTGSLMKVFVAHYHRDDIENLRAKLHEAVMARDDAIYGSFEKEAYTRLSIFRAGLYLTVGMLIPVWLFSRYVTKMADVRLIPIPWPLSEEFLSDNFWFDVSFLAAGLTGSLGLYFILENEMSVFGLLFQIQRESNILLWDSRKLNDHFEEGKREYETLPKLTMIKTKKTVGELCKHHAAIMEYIKVFEKCFSFSMLLQVLIGGTILVSSSLRCILLPEFSAHTTYQLAYSLGVLENLFLYCLLITNIKSAYTKVGDALYSTYWYKMDYDARKKLIFMINVSQAPPRITAMKLWELNLNMFTKFIRVIYSWLTLFAQISTKTK